MRAMAILYIGPHRNPDFATDYYISPILTPSRILAQFPPLLMQCGEKDPFVDDTVIFAGRIREAKRARKVELDLAIAGKSARFGESLRMSTTISEHLAPAEGARLATMKKERDQLAQETEEDWVQMVLFSEWSHGYLQMPSLMSEAKAVIEDLGDWIDDAFWRLSERGAEERPPLTTAGSKAQADRGRSSSSGKHPVRLNITPNPSPFNSETETDDSAITFVPKRLRSLSHSSPDKNAIVGGTNAPQPQGSSWSDETLRDDTHHDDSSKHKSRTSSSGSKDGEVLLSYGDMGDGKGSHRGTPPPGWTKTAGQTISETELMRRRRLLDSHIFD
jgi:hypothetical protein